VSESIFGEQVVFSLGPLGVTRTLLTSLAVSLGLILLAALARQSLRRSPPGILGVLAVSYVTWIEELVEGICGRPDAVVASLSGSLFLFIAACNLVGQLPGVVAPTASLATTSALALVVFVAVPVMGVRARGVRAYVREYFRPSPFLAPLHVISELSRTLALSVRLFGNMMSGHLIVSLLVALTGLFVPMPLMALDLLIGLLQAYIFAILAAVYVGAARAVDAERTDS